METRLPRVSCPLLCVLILLAAVPGSAQQFSQAQPLITQPIDESTRNSARTTPDLQHRLSGRDIRSVQNLSDEFAVAGSRTFLQKGDYTQMRTAEHNH